MGACCVLLAASGVGCNKAENEGREIPAEKDVFLEEVARRLSTLPLGAGQMEEVQDAVGASAGNGYDEEYRMQDLFAAPGCGVGERAETKAGKYRQPLKDLFRESAGLAEEWLDSLAGSDVQIYWPGSRQWDGKTLPVITYDPGDGAERNEGYALQPDGTVKKVMVDEQMAAEQPVWVVNRNSDAAYKSLEMLRREDPDWGSGGGSLLVKSATRADEDHRTLVLRSFTAHRQYDSWFAGGSEFFARMGSVEDFTASTEAEMRLYEPCITDFMIVVRRNQVGEELPLNTVLVSEWTPQLSSCAFCLTEDDGGYRTTWKASAVVKYNSKSYGIELEIPLNSRDDIVWRGALTRSFIEHYSGEPVRFGDVELVLELL